MKNSLSNPYSPSMYDVLITLRPSCAPDTTSTSKHEVFPNKTQPLEASSTHADYFHVDGSPSVPRRHLKSVRGSGGKGRAMRESVGAGEAISKKTQGIGDAVMEVDALIDGIFVRGESALDAVHAC